MNVIDIPLDEIKPYERNPRIIEQAVPYVQKSIEKYGFQNPILLDKNHVIICGHTRYFAVKNLGWKTAPCIVAENLTPKQVKEYRLVDNKVAEKAIWDYELEKLEIQDLGDTAFELLDLGFDKSDLTFGLFEDVNRQGEEEKEPKWQMFHSKEIKDATPSKHHTEELQKPSSSSWLEKGMEYSQKSMQKQRIIIEYEPDDTDFLCDLFRLDEITGYMTAKQIAKRLYE